MIPVGIDSQMPCIHMNEFCFFFQLLYMECSKIHNPVPMLCFATAFLWLVDGSEGINQFLYFSIAQMYIKSSCIHREHTHVICSFITLDYSVCDENTSTLMYVGTYH